jgi:hypothetical protein
MVCQCGGTGNGIKSKVGGELELTLQALFTYLCDLVEDYDLDAT